MNEQHIKNIEIKNFKCFENFKAEGFGRVNLIGGKNNVGKTTFLEALYINLNSKKDIWFLDSIIKTIKGRDAFFASNIADNILNFFKVAFAMNTMLSKSYKMNDINFIKTNHSSVSFNFTKQFTGTKIEYTINKTSKIENISLGDLKDFLLLKTEFSVDKSIHLLRTIGLSNYFINKYYKDVQKLDKEDELNHYLKVFDGDIEKFKIMDKEPQVLYNDNYISFSQLGDGIKKFINIFISIYSTKNGILLIDEIDNGIHYTNLDKLWEIILTISKQQNVQVFATTHSKECIESYARVAKKLEDEEITMTVLARNPKNELKALVYDANMFYSELEQNHEVRGW